MALTTMTTREVNQNFGLVRRAAETGPVMITKHGAEDCVLMTAGDFERLQTDKKSAALSTMDAFAMPDGAGRDSVSEIEFQRLDSYPLHAKFD